MPPPYLLPNYHRPPEYSFSDLRRAARSAVFRGEYSIGFRYLERAMLDTVSLTKTSIDQKKEELRDFARSIRRRFEKQGARAKRITAEDRHSACELAKSQKRSPKSMLQIIDSEERYDNRIRTTTSYALDEMDEIVDGVCRNPEPEFSRGLFDRLDRLFRVESIKDAG